MYKQQTQTKRPTIPTPETATEELHADVVSSIVSTFVTAIKQEAIIHYLVSERKGLYALIINTVYKGQSLETTLGTVNAKQATEDVLRGLSAGIFSVK